ncbi:MAG: peptidoglycan-associated lipoprotein Pal [Deltaproteobacteria bacterium]|nr:peptidoglycan-associated lipoprotein Pal [Deltaproteobacteria bacterium]
MFALAMITVFFMITGCAQTVKKEESIQKSAEPAAQTQPPQPEKEKAPAAKEEAPAPIKEEKVAEQPVKEETATMGEKEARAEAKDEVAAMAEAQGRLLTIYFDFDRFTIRDDMKPVLEKDAAWLKKNSGVKIEIQGHCDERGSVEYNIALGERRAQSIKKYLINAGIDGASLSTISYGKERPVDPRHNEEAWAKNRRGEIVVVKK